MGACFGLPGRPVECFRQSAARIPATARAKRVAMAAKPSNNGFSIDASVLPAATVDAKCSINWNFYRSPEGYSYSLVTQPSPPSRFSQSYLLSDAEQNFAIRKAGSAISNFSFIARSLASRCRIDEKKERNGNTVKRCDWPFVLFDFPRRLCRVTRRLSLQIRERNLEIAVNVLHGFQLLNDFARCTYFAFYRQSFPSYLERRYQKGNGSMFPYYRRVTLSRTKSTYSEKGSLDGCNAQRLDVHISPSATLKVA